MHKPSSQTGYIGQAMRRREDAALLRGAGRFVDDLSPAGCLYLEILRNPYGAGQITKLNVTEAQTALGVVAVFTAADLADLGAASVNALLPGLNVQPMVVLAAERVAAVGQALAVVVAVNRAAARDALDLIEFDVREDDGTPNTRPALRHSWQYGDVAPGDFEVSVVLDHPLVAPMALEPRAALAVPDDAGLTVWLSTQTPQRCRDDLAAMLGLTRKEVRVIAPDVGGAFGGKASLMPEDVLVAFAARRLGQAVKWCASRSDEFQAATQGRGAKSRATLAFDADGRAVSLKADLAFQLGHWMPYSALAPIRNAGRVLPGPYRVAAVQVEAEASLSTGSAVNIYRGAGRPEAAMLMERLMDRAAQLLALDPLEMRRRNLSPLPADSSICSGDFNALLDRLAAETNYSDLRSRQAVRRAAGEICGLGIGLYVEPCGQGWETAEIQLMGDGRLRVLTGSSAQGQGRETAFAQIAADVLKVSPQQVTVIEGDSDLIPEGIGALASRSTAIGGTALWQAGEQLLEKAERLAGPDFEWAALAVRLAAAQAAGLAPTDHPVLSAQVTYHAPAEAWASGAVLAEVAVDGDTGHVTVEQITWIDDAGRVLNPMLLAGQMMGGLAQGLGATLMEQMVYEGGQLLTGSLMDYAVPRAADMPPLRLISQPTASPANTMGFKGVGEAGCIGVPAALLNAVQDAISPKSDCDLTLPLTAETVWRAMTGQM